MINFVCDLQVLRVEYACHSFSGDAPVRSSIAGVFASPSAHKFCVDCDCDKVAKLACP
jgi:hypothetical protein